MKVLVALAVAGVAYTLTAYAQPLREDRRVVIRHGGDVLQSAPIDANDDGWISRAEAIAAAERSFDMLDSDDDGKIDESDERAMGVHRFVHRLADGPATTEDRQERVERRVTIIRHGGDDEGFEIEVPEPPLPPEPPQPPAFMLFISNSEEFDSNNDGALSRDEFLAQHTRFFDAGDGNGDGRIRFDMPDPPEPPEPPQPPAPPRH